MLEARRQNDAQHRTGAALRVSHGIWRRDGAIRVGSVMLCALLTSPVVCRTDAQRDYRFGWSDWRMAWATLQSHMAMLRFAFRDDLRRGVE